MNLIKKVENFVERKEINLKKLMGDYATYLENCKIPEGFTADFGEIGWGKTVLSAEYMGNEKIPESAIQNLYHSVANKASSEIEKDLILLGFIDKYSCSDPSIAPLIIDGYLPDNCGYGRHDRFLPTRKGKEFLKEYDDSIKD